MIIARTIACTYCGNAAISYPLYSNSTLSEIVTCFGLETKCCRAGHETIAERRDAPTAKHTPSSQAMSQPTINNASVPAAAPGSNTYVHGVDVIGL
eukprot:4727305-Pleurochrysis_carterae.AAC.1